METKADLKQQITASNLFNRDDVKKKFQEMLGKKAQGFITSVLQIVASNKMLANADPMSIYNAASVAATLDLPINNNLGFAYIIPYNQKFQDETGQWKSKQVAQFQLSYKGFIQLAQRSGQFKTISATPIYEGQIAENNPLTGIKFDFEKRASETVIGYASYFELLNGFYKTLYLTIDELKKHGAKYSKSYSHKTSIWQDNFDAMAQKTVIKLLLSKYAPLSIEMQKAVLTDQAVINNEDGTELNYIDNECVEVIEVDKELERIQLLINDCKTISDLDLLQEMTTDVDVKLFDKKRKELKSERK